MCFILIRNGLRRILRLAIHLEISFKGVFGRHSFGWKSFVSCLGCSDRVDFTCCVVILVILLCLEVLRLGLGDLHIRGQICIVSWRLWYLHWSVDMICRMCFHDYMSSGMIEMYIIWLYDRCLLGVYLYISSLDVSFYRCSFFLSVEIRILEFSLFF